MRGALFSVLALAYACGLTFGFTYLSSWYLDWCMARQNQRLGTALWMLVFPFALVAILAFLFGTGILLYMGFN